MNELFNNLKTLWGGLPKQRRIMLLVVAVVVMAILIGSVVFANRPNMTILFASLPQEEAGRVITYLKEKKIPYELTEDHTTATNSIKVPDHLVYETRLQLIQAGMPHKSDTAGGVGFELLDKPTFGLSDFMQKANYNRAKEGELARTIKAFDPIQEARVMIVVPERRLFQKEQGESKASVLLSLKPGREIGAKEVKAIRDLVANSVEGLKPDHVAVADSSGKSLAEDDSGTGLNGLTSSQLNAEISYERHIRDQAQGLLDRVLGPEQSTVQVHIDMDFSNTTETYEKFDPKTQTPRTETSTNEESSTKTEAIAGVAGEKINTEMRSSSEPGANTTSVTKREQATNAYEIDKRVGTRQLPQGSVTRMTVAVVANVRKSGIGPTANVQVRTQQELDDLEKIVKNAVGFVDNGIRKDEISVQEAAFAEIFPADAGKDSLKTLGLPSTILPLVSQGFLVLLAVGLLLYLRSILKTSSESETDAAGEFSSLLGRYKKMADEALAEANRDKSPPPFLTADELGKLIRDNPTNTSQAIRVWLSRN